MQQQESKGIGLVHPPNEEQDLAFITKINGSQTLGAQFPMKEVVLGVERMMEGGLIHGGKVPPLIRCTTCFGKLHVL